MQNCTHFKRGSQSKIAVVFSCPGKVEEEKGYPAARVTGNNLNQLLKLLSDDDRIKLDATRDKITITNAWSKVEYDGLHGKRTEATTEEILQRKNLKRLENELKLITNYIICFGEKAYLSVCTIKIRGKLKKGCRILFSRHLSNKSLNQIKFDVCGNKIFSAKVQKEQGIKGSKKSIGQDNTKKRLKIVAENLIGQILNFNLNE